MAYYLLVNHGWRLETYDSLPYREKRLTNEMVLRELNERKKDMQKAEKGG